MTSKDIKIGLKVILTPKVGTESSLISFWGSYIGCVFEVKEVTGDFVWLIPPKIRTSNKATISKREFWDYFRLPSSYQLEFDFD